MQIRKIREHFVSKDDGFTWIPKASFESPQEAEEKGFDPNKWKAYSCSFCDKFHMAKINRRRRNGY